MRHNVSGKKLGRTIDERGALFKNLAQTLIVHGHVKTTKTKAKAVQPLIEKLVTKAKEGTVFQIREISKTVTSDHALRLVSTIAPVFSSRNGGYTRIIRLGNRIGDNAPVVLLEWVESIPVVVAPEKTKTQRVKKAPKGKAVEAEVVAKAKKEPEAKKEEAKTTKKAAVKKTVTKKKSK